MYRGCGPLCDNRNGRVEHVTGRGNQFVINVNNNVRPFGDLVLGTKAFDCSGCSMIVPDGERRFAQYLSNQCGSDAKRSDG